METNITEDRFSQYKQNHCWQYDIRLKNLDIDIANSGFTLEQIKNIKISDFDFEFVPKTCKMKCREITAFIEHNEWLGTMPMRPTHRFTARYKGVLAGVIVMSTPNAFNLLLGSNNRRLEKLISRGACISWSPKNLASSLLMWSINWMVNHTHYRVFVAYSDPEAKELGTIYQACNFIYLGQTSGTQKAYFDPQKPEKGWFSDRIFRSRSKYKQYAKELGICWMSDWQAGDKIIWDNMPKDIESKIREKAKEYENSCITRLAATKHKYCCILGQDKRETKSLIKLFRKLNPTKIDLPYPKERGQ
jgi:hypothetical protein